MQTIQVYMYMKFPQFPIPASEGKHWKESSETVPEVTVVLGDWVVPQQQEVGHEFGRYHSPRQQQFGQALRSSRPQLTVLNNTIHQELITLGSFSLSVILKSHCTSYTVGQSGQNILNEVTQQNTHDTLTITKFITKILGF